MLYPVYFWAISPQKRCQAPARSQHAPRPWALPAAARRPRAGCPGERPPPLAPPRPLPAHGRRASPRSRASRRFADATVYPRSLAIESDDPIFRVAEVCLHPLPKAHALWREKVIAAGPAISHFATHPRRRVLGVLLLHRFCGRPERGSGRFSAPSAHGILGGVGAAPTAGSGASRPASATLCRGDLAVRRRTARLPRASARRDEPPRLPPWLRRRPSRTARRDRSRVRGLTHLSRPRVRLSDPRLPFPRRHHRHGRRRPCGTRGTSRPPWRCWPLPRRRSYPPHRWCTASAAPLGASPVILPPPPPPPPV